MATFDPSGIAAAGVGGALDIAGSAYSARQEYKYAKRMYKHRYQWQMEDMQKAGLNPMLSFSQGAPNPSAPSVDMKGLGSRAVANYATAKQVAAQNDLLRTQENKTRAEGESIEMENRIKATSPEYQAALKAHDEYGSPAAVSAVSERRFNNEMAKIEAETKNIVGVNELQQLEKALKQGDMSLQQIEIRFADELKDLSIAYQRAMTEAAQLGLPQARAEAKFWEQVGVGGAWAAKLKELIPGLKVGGGGKPPYSGPVPMPRRR